MKTFLTIYFICTSYLFCPFKACAQNVFNIMMYNCENAFDTKHDQGKNDEEYLGGSPRFWNRTRYFAKLRSIGKVITSVDSIRPVDIVGLCEVENDSVLCDLLNRTPLRNIGYEYVMTNSLDERGIDVALLYMPYSFHLISHTSLRAQTVPRATYFMFPEKSTAEILSMSLWSTFPQNSEAVRPFPTESV